MLLGLFPAAAGAVDLTGDKVVFSDPMTRESNPDATESSSNEPVYLYDTDTGRQVRVLERETPESLSPIYSRLVDGVEADGGEIGIADDYVAGPDGPSISPIISVLDAETGKPIQRLDDPDMTGPKEQISELDEAAIEELVTLARRTDAEITFIEDARLLEPARHVGAMLRYRV